MQERYEMIWEADFIYGARKSLLIQAQFQKAHAKLG